MLARSITVIFVLVAIAPQPMLSVRTLVYSLQDCDHFREILKAKEKPNSLLSLMGANILSDWAFRLIDSIRNVNVDGCKVDTIEVSELQAICGISASSESMFAAIRHYLWVCGNSDYWQKAWDGVGRMQNLDALFTSEFLKHYWTANSIGEREVGGWFTLALSDQDLRQILSDSSVKDAKRALIEPCLIFVDQYIPFLEHVQHALFAAGGTDNRPLPLPDALWDEYLRFAICRTILWNSNSIVNRVENLMGDNPNPN